MQTLCSWTNKISRMLSWLLNPGWIFNVWRSLISFNVPVSISMAVYIFFNMPGGGKKFLPLWNCTVRWQKLSNRLLSLNICNNSCKSNKCAFITISTCNKLLRHRHLLAEDLLQVRSCLLPSQSHFHEYLRLMHHKGTAHGPAVSKCHRFS